MEDMDSKLNAMLNDPAAGCCGMTDWRMLKSMA